MKNANLNDDILSAALRKLPGRVPPAALATALRVMASKERERVLTRQTLAARWVSFTAGLRLIVDNSMRPMAIPFAGGVFSAVVLFSMWVVPTYGVRASSTYDIPTMLTTEAGVKGTAPVDAAYGEIVVDVNVDGAGRMIDYTIVSGQGLLQDHRLRRRLENMLLFTEFVPATSFGKPMTGRMRLSLHSLSAIDVKG
jgi:hypothetical protein